MTRRGKPALEPARDDVEAALAALGAGELREIVRDLLRALDERAHGRLVDSLVERAARGGSGFSPAPLGDREVAEVLAFVEAAGRSGHADSSDVDEYLRLGSGAFLRKDYAVAHRIFGALLPPIGDGEIDLGQHEVADEVLGADLGECAARYVASAYMIAPPAQRAEAVRAAIRDAGGFGSFEEPIREIERVALEPLPGLDEFLPRWRAVVAREADGEGRSDWDRDEDRWLREVVKRLEGVDGLAEVARSTRRADDLHAWCRTLVEAGDWKSALRAFDEAAALVAGRDGARADLLDGAARAARELGRSDLPVRLERAWRAGPSLLRLRRWLGSARDEAAIRARAAEALAACPERAHRQRALLHVLAGDLEPAAKLLATAPGLGWSGEEHPGHLLFPLFQALLGGETATPATFERATAHEDEAERRPPAPGIDRILQQAGIHGIPDAAARRAVLAGMQKAAERRLAGVTEQKRRAHYPHAAELVAACLACDRSPEAARWVASIRAEHRRFHALRAELDRALGSP